MRRPQKVEVNVLTPFFITTSETEVPKVITSKPRLILRIHRVLGKWKGLEKKWKTAKAIVKKIQEGFFIEDAFRIIAKVKIQRPELTYILF
ncbi:MAG: hypothetical protein LBD88_02415 [Candidatus Peribacteria bacterium]|jgi:hypothetical protein|nr:hypothetical protein [Candidatus Peribacteria bacterium]